MSQGILKESISKERAAKAYSNAYLKAVANAPHGSPGNTAALRALRKRSLLTSALIMSDFPTSGAAWRAARGPLGKRKRRTASSKKSLVQRKPAKTIKPMTEAQIEELLAKATKDLGGLPRKLKILSLVTLGLIGGGYGLAHYLNKDEKKRKSKVSDVAFKAGYDNTISKLSSWWGGELQKKAYTFQGSEQSNRLEKLFRRSHPMHAAQMLGDAAAEYIAQKTVPTYRGSNQQVQNMETMIGPLPGPFSEWSAKHLWGPERTEGLFKKFNSWWNVDNAPQPTLDTGEQKDAVKTRVQKIKREPGDAQGV